MKNLMIAFTLLLITTASFAQKNHTNKRQQKMKAALARYHDNIDNRMKGPNGEMIYMSPNGGRYYIKNDKKIYIEYKGNKK